MVITCLLMCLLPSGSPRYIYPLFVIPCLLLAQVFVEGKTNSLTRRCLKWWHWINALLLVVGALAVVAIPFIAGFNPGSFVGLVIGIAITILAWVIYRLPKEDPRPVDLAARAAMITGLVFAAGMITYGAAMVPRVDALTTNGFREVAARIRQELPTGAILWVQENEYRPFWYYLEPDVRYFLSISDLPADARYFLLPEAAAPGFAADPRLADRHLHSLAPVVDGERQRFEILGEK
jgi:hypothetical protein